MLSRRKADVRRHFVAAGAPLLLVAGDPFPAAEPDVRHLEERDKVAILSAECILTARAQITVGLGEGAAEPAQPEQSHPLGQPAHRRLQAGDPPLGALVVDDVLRRELADRQEAGASDVLATPARHPGAHREGWEVVAGQEAFGGQVAVGVEVAFLPGHVVLPEQAPLAHGLLHELARLALVLATPGTLGQPIGFLQPCLGNPPQLAPAVERAIEGSRCLIDDPLQPALAEPASDLGQRSVMLEDPLQALEEGCTTLRMELELGTGRLPERQLVLFDVDHLLDRGAQGQPHLGQPLRVHMRLQERRVRQLQPRRAHGAGHQIGAVAEEVAVVAAGAAAEGEDQTGLPLAASAAAALGVVGRRRRHVSEVDEVEVGNVDPQLHRRGADQVRQSPAEARVARVVWRPAEAPLPTLALPRRHDLCRVLPRLERA
ncbi:hypothetical protein HRbin26_02185 [bacterium HR26]|nr:hypothetical protein HRbin26_02185 [bacterium HR26]